MIPNKYSWISHEIYLHNTLVWHTSKSNKNMDLLERGICSSKKILDVEL